MKSSRRSKGSVSPDTTKFVAREVRLSIFFGRVCRMIWWVSVIVIVVLLYAFFTRAILGG